MELAGKRVLVTGGADRLGKEIALGFARHRAEVIIHFNKSEKEAFQTAAEVEALGTTARTFQADLSDQSQVTGICKTLLEVGGVDVIVNNASSFEPTPFPAQDEEWEKILRIAIDAPFQLSNMLAPAMIAKGEGVIINMLDLSVVQVWRNFSAHSVGKNGLQALTRQLALELAPYVRVNAVAAGYFLPPQAYTDIRIKEIAKQIPLQRWGRAEELVEAVLFLTSADYMTGTTLYIDGGASLKGYR